MRIRHYALPCLCAIGLLLGSAATALPQGHTGHGDHPAPRSGGDDQHPPKSGAPQTLPPFIPPITDEDRAAAFPDVHPDHAVHGDAVHAFVLFDRLEWQSGDAALDWSNSGWVGGDLHRFWFRTTGALDGRRLTRGSVHALYGRAIARWWDLVAGVRQDVRPGPARTWAALGVQGLAPYWFEVQATAYVGEGGRTHLHLETEYDLLLTNRLILQPVVEADVYGRADDEHGTAAGLSSAEAGLRLRYELRRELAPYIGLAWHRRFFGTADRARAAGRETGGMALTLGIRAWF